MNFLKKKNRRGNIFSLFLATGGQDPNPAELLNIYSYKNKHQKIFCGSLQICGIPQLCFFAFKHQ